MSNSFKPCPTHFSRGGENFSRRALPTLRPPGYGPVNTGFVATFGRDVTSRGALMIRFCAGRLGEHLLRLRPMDACRAGPRKCGAHCKT